MFKGPLLVKRYLAGDAQEGEALSQVTELMATASVPAGHRHRGRW
ncbi:hypothetical protein [Ectothiorhodospira variabilis]|nr:hypothetical protein [Ectothiorhodospira variabilis]